MKDLLFTIKHYRKQMKAQKLRLYPAIIVGVVAAILSLAIPWFSKFFIDEILVNKNIEFSIPFLLFWLFFDIVRQIGYSLRSVSSYNITAILTVDSGIVILNKIHNCAKRIFKKYSPGELITHINDLETCCYTYMDVLVEASEIIFYLIALPFAFLLIDIKLALIVGMTVVLCVISSFVLSRIIDRLHFKKRREEGVYAQNILSAIEHSLEMRNYGIYERLCEEIHIQNYFIKHIGLHRTLVSKAGNTVNRTIFSVGTFLYRLLSVGLIYKGKMTIGDFFAFNAVLSLLFSPIEMLTSFVQPLQEIAVNSRRLKTLLSYEEQSRGDRCPGKDIRLRVDNICFKYYDDAAPFVIDGFCGDFIPSRIYGIVGHNGAGKSTLLQLIARYYDVDSGAIVYGSSDIRTIKSDLYSATVVYIPTAGYVFSTSFKNNICLMKGYDDHRFKDIVETLKVANLESHFSNYDEKRIMGKEAPSVSSGEKQKIVLARAIYHNFKIYLFDEAFSYFDAEYQRYLIKIFKKYMSDSIVLIASHDIDIISMSDEILYIKGGRLAERGTYNQLSRSGSGFSMLFQKSLGSL